MMNAAVAAALQICLLLTDWNMCCGSHTIRQCDQQLVTATSRGVTPCHTDTAHDAASIRVTVYLLPESVEFDPEILQQAALL